MTHRYFVEYGALQEYQNPDGSNPHRVIECTTSGNDAVKIDEDFARKIADALNRADALSEAAPLAEEARNMAKKCNAKFMNCVYADQDTNDMLMEHARLFRKLARAISGPDEEDAFWDDLNRRFKEKYGGDNGKE